MARRLDLRGGIYFEAFLHSLNLFNGLHWWGICEVISLRLVFRLRSSGRCNLYSVDWLDEKRLFKAKWHQRICEVRHQGWYPHTHTQSSNTHTKSICHLSDQTSSLPLAYSSVLFGHRCVFVDCLRSLGHLQTWVKKRDKVCHKQMKPHQ